MAQAAEQKAAIIWNDLKHVELKQKHLINMINALFVSRTSQMKYASNLHVKHKTI